MATYSQGHTSLPPVNGTTQLVSQWYFKIFFNILNGTQGWTTMDKAFAIEHCVSTRISKDEQIHTLSNLNTSHTKKIKLQ